MHHDRFFEVSDPGGRFLAPVCFLHGLFFLALAVSFWLKPNRLLKAASQSGELPCLLADFSESKPYMEDHIRLGRIYLYSYGGGQYLPISGIVRFYAEAYKTPALTIDYSLWVVDTRGMQHCIYKQSKDQNTEREVAVLMNALYRNNPGIRFR